MASVSGSAGQRQPTCIIVLGMAGSGKSTFVKKLVEYLSSTETGQPYTVNLDPAVYHTPYHANIGLCFTWAVSNTFFQTSEIPLNLKKS